MQLKVAQNMHPVNRRETGVLQVGTDRYGSTGGATSRRGGKESDFEAADFDKLSHRSI